MMSNKLNTLIKFIEKDIDACCNPNEFSEPIEYGTMIGLKMALRLAQALLVNDETEEVVRCKDCKHWLKNSNLSTDTSGCCSYHRIDVYNDDSCSYGERK